MLNVDVSFVIPCLNEQKTLAQAISFCKDAIKNLGTNCEIVVADNGSTDDSIQIATSLGARVINAPHKGYGNALIHGIKKSNGKYIVMGDADATYDFRESIKFIELIKAKSLDLVMGSRLKGNIEPNAMPFLHRYLGTPVLSWFIRRFFKLPISDCNCGMRVFTKEAFNKMNLISGGMEFASEMLIKAGVLNLKVEEVPCSLYKDNRGRPPHLKTWRDGWRHLKFILTFAPKYIFYYPGIITMLIGLILMIMVSFGRITLFNIPFDYNFIYAGSMFLIIGYQLRWLSIFEKYYVNFVGYLTQQKLAKFEFDKYARLSGGMLLVAITLILISVINWAKHIFIADGLNIRLLIWGINFLIISAMNFTNALMVSMMQVKIYNKE